MRIFVMGTGDGHRDSEGRMFHGGYWRSETSWPLPETEWKSFFFHADGSLRLDAPQHDAPATRYLYDPDDPVPTLGGAFSSTSPVFEPGAYDQSEREEFYGSKPPYLPLHARSDVVVFQTEPLEEPVEIVGSVTTSRWAPCSGSSVVSTYEMLTMRRSKYVLVFSGCCANSLAIMRPGNTTF